MVRAMLAAGFEPIIGYVLKEKLGSGGYGEVWSAEAPGGLSKAIKFVFGGIDDDRGATELKSLNRIRKLNHPFILSLERLEIIDKQLVIVTELAQGSLFDRFSEYRHKGFVGIPRDRLVRYLADAADGLDYLCQEHDLQHLDVKPGNLLLVADRVKVADFGLVKDLQAASQSMMSGMTPTYAAPEMFDGRPGRYSDQYSLAIVYQELLTGTLPFRGRTAAQLANEHMNKAPNLEAVPLMERPVLSKALSKKPHMRYGDCREFIQALMDCRAQATLGSGGGSEPLKKEVAPAKTPMRVSPRRVPDSDTDPHAVSDKRAFEKQALEIQFENETRPVQLQQAMPPVAPDSMAHPSKILYLGLGGSGGLALQQLHQMYRKWSPAMLDGSLVRWLCIDTDWDSLQRLTLSEKTESLSHRDLILLRLNSAQYFRKATSPDLHRVSRRWVFNIPRSLKTEGIRPLGMLAFLDQARACYDHLLDAIEELLHEDASDRSLTVYVMGSAHGGTGGAIVSEIGFLLRQLAANSGVRIEIQTLLLCADSHARAGGDLAAASAVACLGEIRKYVESRGLHEPLHSLPGAVAMDPSPFDFLTLLHGGTLGDDRDWKNAIDQLADYVWLLDRSDLGRRIGRARELDRRRLENGAEYTGDLWLGTVGVEKLNLASLADSGASSSRCSLIGIQAWISILKHQLDAIQQTSPTQTHHTGPEPLAIEQPWVLELCRTLQLSVPTWVRRIMGAIAPMQSDSRVGNASVPQDSSHASPSLLGEALELAELADIDAIAEKLAIDSSLSGQSLRELMHQCRLQLLQWLEQHALQSVYGWKYLGAIVNTISARLQENAVVAFEIAKQLAHTHDAALESVYGSADAPPKQVDYQLDALALEMRFHALAGRLFVRLAEDVRQLAQLWSLHARQLMAQLTHMAIPLMSELGIRDQDFTSKHPDFSKIGKDPFSCTAMSLLADYVHSRLATAWEVKKSIHRNPRIECDDLNRLQSNVKAIIESLGGASHSSGDAVRRESDRATDNPLWFLLDPHGWGRVFGEIGDGHVHPWEEHEKFAIGQTQGAVNIDLRDEFDRAVPPLVKFGGITRNAFLISDELSTLLNDQHLQQVHDRCATIISDPIPSHCLVCSIGERLDLTTVMERTWPQTRSLVELTQRLVCHSG